MFNSQLVTTALVLSTMTHAKVVSPYRNIYSFEHSCLKGIHYPSNGFNNYLLMISVVITCLITVGFMFLV